MTKCVVIVDDDTAASAVYETVLKMEGFAVKTYISGELALTAIDQDGAPDLILLDSSMPTMTGVEFIKTLHRKARPSNPKLPCPVIGFSSFKQGSSINSEFESLVTHYYEKPDDISLFLDIIQRHLG